MKKGKRQQKKRGGGGGVERSLWTQIFFFNNSNVLHLIRKGANGPMKPCTQRSPTANQQCTLMTRSPEITQHSGQWTIPKRCLLMSVHWL